MAEYRLLTIWRIEAPLDVVYAAIHNSPRWPDWWTGMKKVELIAAGDADGGNSVLRYSWHGRLPYRMVFEVRATRIEKLVAIEGTVQGDLEGYRPLAFFPRGRGQHRPLRVACPECPLVDESDRPVCPRDVYPQPRHRHAARRGRAGAPAWCALGEPGKH